MPRVAGAVSTGDRTGPDEGIVLGTITERGYRQRPPRLASHRSYWWQGVARPSSLCSSRGIAGAASICASSRSISLYGAMLEYPQTGEQGCKRNCFRYSTALMFRRREKARRIFSGLPNPHSAEISFGESVVVSNRRQAASTRAFSRNVIGPMPHSFANIRESWRMLTATSRARDASVCGFARSASINAWIVETLESSAD
jgi:hypothetical protein